VVLDPPRSGAGREVVDRIVKLAGRAIAYVSCDPATLARDLAYFGERGWTLETLRAFDAFPMTHHVELVATLTRG
jgi:tRNA/tmRNA/rRNA uracil-C5-methylase (TrmA/RlmC/RlmD family)